MSTLLKVGAMSEGQNKHMKRCVKATVVFIAMLGSFFAATPVSAQEFTLAPTVSTSRIQVSQGETAEFQFTVVNEGPNASNSSAWVVQEIIFGPGSGNGNALTGGYGRTCDFFLDRGARSCNGIYNGPARPFPVGNTDVTNQIPENVRSFPVDDSITLGTKICRVLTVARPSHDAAVTSRWSDVSCVTYSSRPNVHFFGGDVSVGNPYRDQSADCSLRPNTGGIYTAANAANNGSTAEYAAFARGVIQVELAIGHSFGTTSRTGITRANVDKLAFANTEDSPGQFALNKCMTDYYQRFRAESAAVPSPGTRTLSGLTGRQRLNYNGELTISASDIADGANIVVVVQGNVIISGNIRYGGAANPTYPNVEAIPGLAIISSGNIQIEESVTQVDGAIISKGILTTCSGAPSQLTTRICNEQLNLNGVVMTDGLRLPRTFGGSGSNATRPAERFTFTTEMFFNNVLAEKRDDLIDVVEVRDLPPRY